MATYRDAASFARAVHGYKEKVERAKRQAVSDAALAVKTSTLAEIRDASGDLRLSGVGRRGAKLNVRYDIKGTDRPTALVRAVGPVHLIERSTKPHEIGGRRRRRGRSRSGRPLLTIGTDVVTGPVQHPGTSGKHPWRRGVIRVQPLIPKILRAAFLRHVR